MLRRVDIERRLEVSNTSSGMNKTKSAASLRKKAEVRMSGVHGRGVFAKKQIRPSELIGVYAGKRYAAAEIATRTWDACLTYVFGLSDGSVIDASKGGNATRFINHACEPNCIAYEVETKSGLEIEIWAKRGIPSGSELSLDYSLDIADNAPELYACRCASPNCRGTMRAATTKA